MSGSYLKVGLPLHQPINWQYRSGTGDARSARLFSLSQTFSRFPKPSQGFRRKMDPPLEVENPPILCHQALARYILLLFHESIIFKFKLGTPYPSHSDWQTDTEGHPRFPDFQSSQQFYFCRSQSILLPNVQNSPTDIITQTNLYSLFGPYLFASKLRHLCTVFILNECLKKKLFSPSVQLFSIAKCLF